MLLRSVIAPSLRTRDADANYSPAVAIDDQTRYASGRKWDQSCSPHSQPVSLCLRFRFIGFQGCEMWNPRGEILGEAVHNSDNSWGTHGDTDFLIDKGLVYIKSKKKNCDCLRTLKSFQTGLVFLLCTTKGQCLSSNLKKGWIKAASNHNRSLLKWATVQNVNYSLTITRKNHIIAAFRLKCPYYAILRFLILF